MDTVTGLMSLSFNPNTTSLIGTPCRHDPPPPLCIANSHQYTLYVHTYLLNMAIHMGYYCSLYDHMYTLATYLYMLLLWFSYSEVHVSLGMHAIEHHNPIIMI